ncbi:unnamed protein product, partial [Meganyctiphanes norvegica]
MAYVTICFHDTNEQCFVPIPIMFQVPISERECHRNWVNEILKILKWLVIGFLLVNQEFLKYVENTDFSNLTTQLENKFGRVWVEKVFRGKNYGVQEISKVAYKWDYHLIDKFNEKNYIEAMENIQINQEERILPQSVPMPPMLKYIV